MRTDGSHELAAARDSRHSALSRNPFIGGGRQAVFILFLSACRVLQWARQVRGSVWFSVNIYFTNPRLVKRTRGQLFFLKLSGQTLNFTHVSVYMYLSVCPCIYEHFLIVPRQTDRPGSKSFRQSPPWSLFGLLGPPGPHELPTKSPQCYSNNRPRDKEHIYTSGAFFESKKALFGRFPNLYPPSQKKKKKQSPLCPSTPHLSIPLLKKVHHSSDGDVGAKYTTPSPIPPANPQAPPI